MYGDRCSCSSVRGITLLPYLGFFFFKTPAPPQIYTLSLHDALPILAGTSPKAPGGRRPDRFLAAHGTGPAELLQGTIANFRGDRKSTRLNSSHTVISYAVFCLKKKNDERVRQGVANRRIAASRLSDE